MEVFLRSHARALLALLTFALVCMVGFGLPSARAQTSYTIVGISAPASCTDPTPADVNSLGTVVGSYWSGSTRKSFTWTQAGGLVTLTDIGSPWAQAERVSDDGTMIAGSFNQYGMYFTAYWQNGVVNTPIQTRLNSFPAVAILSNGQVAAMTNISSNIVAGLFTPTVNTTENMTSTLSLSASKMVDMNDAGQVLQINGTVTKRPGGASFSVPFVNGYAISAVRMSPYGAITGECSGTVLYTSNAVLWRPLVPNGSTGRTTIIPTLGGSVGLGADVNCWNEVVGYSNPATGGPHAFLYRDGQVTDLNTYATAGWVFSIATGISDSGIIVGKGTYYGVGTGFVLIPNN